MHSITLWPTVLVLAIATFTDLRSRRIPNWLVFPFLLAGLLVSTIAHGIPGLGQSMLGFLLAVGVLGLLHWLGGMGMGDVKLCAAIGAWIGPKQLTTALVLTALAGGLMAIVWSLSNGYFKAALANAGDLVFGLGKRRFRPHPTLSLSHPESHKMPYAPAIAIGTLLSFLAGAA